MRRDPQIERYMDNSLHRTSDIWICNNIPILLHYSFLLIKVCNSILRPASWNFQDSKFENAIFYFLIPFYFRFKSHPIHFFTPVAEYVTLVPLCDYNPVFSTIARKGKDNFTLHFYKHHNHFSKILQHFQKSSKSEGNQLFHDFDKNRN